MHASFKWIALGLVAAIAIAATVVLTLRITAGGAAHEAAAEPSPSGGSEVSVPATSVIKAAAVQSRRAVAYGASYAGHVFDEGGSPVEGAQVWIGSPEVSTITKYVESRRQESPPEDRASTSSASDGSFHLWTPAETPCRIWGRRGRTAPSWTEVVSPVPGAVCADIELVIPSTSPDSAISGVLLDPLGEPVAAGRVSFWESSEVAPRHRFDGGASSFVPTGPDGRFVIEVPPSTTTTLIGTDGGGRWSDAAWLDVKAGTTGIEIRLEEHWKLDIVVRDEGGRPVSGCLVYASDPGARLTEHYRGPATSDADGLTTLGVPTWPFHVHTSCRGFKSQRSELLQRSTLPTTLELVLVRVPSVRGRVLAEGEPAVGAVIERLEVAAVPATTVLGLDTRLQNTSYGSRTDEDGAFTVPIPESADFELRISVDGFAPKVIPSAPSWGREAVDLGDIEVDDGGTLVVRAVALDDRHTFGVDIAISRGDGLVLLERTDLEGEARFRRLTAGTWTIVESRRPGDDGSGESASNHPATCEVRGGETTHFDLVLAMEQ